MAAGSEPSDARGRQLSGRVALITGAASGPGRAAAQLFADHGAAIVVADVNEAGGRETVERIEKDGGRATALHADVAIRRDCDAMITTAIDTYGRLDVLYNSAATQLSSRLVETSEEMWDAAIATNLSAIFWACRAAIPHMLAGSGGTIVNTVSTRVQQGSEGCAAYDAAAAGLIALTRHIAVEYGPHIRANVLAPGSIDPDDVARLALFLAGDTSACVSGAVIPCDVGRASFSTNAQAGR
jgi:NAD(P)-dependent dehydrogenase (short-subunit alcohol dehydrogenase family)